ncbi:MAG: WS/DGAT domain-containing protein [Novosphingobium sp.]
MIAPLGTQIDDPLERLAYVHSQTVNSKAMTDAIGARNMTEMSKVSPALFMALGETLLISVMLRAPIASVIALELTVCEWT